MLNYYGSLLLSIFGECNNCSVSEVIYILADTKKHEFISIVFKYSVRLASLRAISSVYTTFTTRLCNTLHYFLVEQINFCYFLAKNN